MLEELEELEDIIDTLVFEDEPPLFTSEYAIDFIETAMLLMDEYIKDNPHVISEPEFHDILLEEIKDILNIQIEDYINKSYKRDDIEQDIDDMIEEAFTIFMNSFYPNIYWSFRCICQAADHFYRTIIILRITTPDLYYYLS